MNETANDVKFKDARPIDTISKIRNILRGLGIMTIETWNESNVDDCYSVRIAIAGTKYGTNGKGATVEYALASGYAEFMERLQTDFIYIGKYRPETTARYGFFCAPDEKYSSSEELAKNPNEWVDLLLSRLIADIRKDNQAFSFLYSDNEEAGIEEKIAAINRWKFLPSGISGDDFVTLPFYDVKNGCLHHIPFSILRSTYGSNGICAGNTPYEAFVQGLSELFERHSNAVIIKDKITPPTVPDEYLKKFGRLASIIRDIESKGSYKVIVKDCSLGKGYPVIAVILIDYAHQTYRVKFGAHPSFEIALERSLTELFQGVSLKTAAKTNPFFYGDPGIYGPINIQNILKNSVGYYPIELFSEKFSYEFTPFEDVTGVDNKTMLDRLLKMLFDTGHNLYIRDVSFLGFNSYHLISPGFSELYEYGLLTMKERCSKCSIEKIMENLHEASEEDLETIAIYIQYKFPAVYENTMPFLYHLPLKDKFFCGEESCRFLLVLVFYKLGKLDRAYKEINTVISKVKSGENADKDLIIRLKCMKDYIGMVGNGRKTPENEKLISRFYPEEIYRTVAMQLNDPEKVFDHFYKKTNCWNCEECGFGQECYYNILEKAYLSVKKRHHENPIDQMKLKDLFH
jgi:ribosomal protein S12 methylthiotransferase accessory factor